MPREVIDLVSSDDEAATNPHKGKEKACDGAVRPTADFPTKATDGLLNLSPDISFDDLDIFGWLQTDRATAAVGNGSARATGRKDEEVDFVARKRRKLSDEMTDSNSFGINSSAPVPKLSSSKYRSQSKAYILQLSDSELEREALGRPASKSPSRDYFRAPGNTSTFAMSKRCLATTDPNAHAVKRAKLSDKKGESDLFVSTSSAPVQAKRTVKHGSLFDLCIEDLSDSEGERGTVDNRGGKSVLGTQLSEQTTALLARINGSKKPVKTKAAAGKKMKENDILDKGSGSREESVRSRSPSAAYTGTGEKPLAKKRVRLTSAERELKLQVKEQNKTQKTREKEDEKEKRRLEKEAQKREKDAEKVAQKVQKEKASALADINRANTDKRITVLEMIVDLPSSIRGQAVDTQIREFLRSHNVAAVEYDSPVPNVIRWRRKVAKQYNEELGHWEAGPQRIETEKHVMCLLSAKEFVDLAIPTDDDGEDLEKHVAKLKMAYKDCIPMYLIEGLDTLMKKSKNARNRVHQAAARNAMGAADGATTTSRRKKDEIIDEDRVEDELLRLQVIHHCLIHQTATSVETAEWVATGFTQHISTIPYRSQKSNADASFCMEAGQIKCGEDKEDTFIKMLQENVRMTQSVAQGVAGQYPSVIDLVRGFRKEGPLLLQDLEKTANRNGGLSGARIGPALSTRLYKVFMGQDPASMDI